MNIEQILNTMVNNANQSAMILQQAFQQLLAENEQLKQQLNSLTADNKKEG